MDAIATLDTGENRLSVAAVNRHMTQEASLRVDHGGLPAGRLAVHTLTAADPLARNTIETPDAVVPVTERVDQTPERLRLAPCSVTVFEWLLQPGEPGS